MEGPGLMMHGASEGHCNATEGRRPTLVKAANAVRGVGRIPSGTLYATLMDRMSASAFESMIGQLVGTGLIRRECHELVWVGDEHQERR
jgi:hypothetical protein